MSSYRIGVFPSTSIKRAVSGFVRDKDRRAILSLDIAPFATVKANWAVWIHWYFRVFCNFCSATNTSLWRGDYLSIYRSQTMWTILQAVRTRYSFFYLFLLGSDTCNFFIASGETSVADTRSFVFFYHKFLFFLKLKLGYLSYFSTLGTNNNFFIRRNGCIIPRGRIFYVWVDKVMRWTVMVFYYPYSVGGFFGFVFHTFFFLGFYSQNPLHFFLEFLKFRNPKG